jgi:LacI family transcriptional regulator
VPRHHRVTIKEIAAMCGVSTQTVSRVINKRPDVSPGTRAQVEAAIAAMGFRPSAVARSLVQRQSRTLGVLAAGLSYVGVAQTLNGIAEESEAADYALLLKEISGEGSVDILPIIDFFIGHRVDGIILAAPDLGSDLAATLPASTPPIVFLKSHPSPAFSAIIIDNYRGARQATEHLLALGRKRVGHLAGPLSWREARDRQDGWRDALRDAGVAPGPVVAGDWSSASGVTAFEQMLVEAPDIDAVFCGNDQMALGLLNVANARGIEVPAQLAVVGFDGLDESAQFTPPLTTMRQPLRELGRLAVQQLLASLDDATSHEPRRLTLSAELVVRESAPAPAVSRAPTGSRALAGAGGRASRR